MNLTPTRPPSGSGRFHHQLLADAVQLTQLRADLACWLATLIPPWADIQREDIVLATYEALANATEHAYHDRTPGQVTLEADRTDNELTITVRDNGGWRIPTNRDPHRGRGLHMIRLLADRNTITNNPHGTEVTMTWRRAAA
ncbi:MAG TPA: ATP-binding protein [Pseudonocardia sp.]|jgi:serine/threonine-protein kinase RsbW